MSTGTSVVEPFKLAKRGAELEGSIAISSLERARQFLATDQGVVSYSVAFVFDAEQRCVVKGKLQAVFSVICDRCSQSFEQDLQADFACSPVQNDIEAKDLPSDYEPVIIADGKLDLNQLIEDEFILAQPIVPKHQLGSQECIEIASTTVENKHNPFDVLQNLKLKKTGQEAGDK